MADAIRSKGGGWYELPDGRKIRKSELVTLLGNGDGRQAGNTTIPTSRFSFIRKAGLQYGGNRDVYKVAGYTAQGSEDFDGYWALYDRDPIAGRVVDMPAKTTWRTPPEIIDGEDEHTEDTEFEGSFKEVAKRVRMWRHFERADRLARIGRYSVLFIGTRGAVDADLKEEQQKLTGSEDILYLSSYAEKYAKITQWEKDPQSPRFGLPTIYELDLSGGTEGFSKSKLLVHHTRVLHVAEDTLLDEVYGRPALKRVLNHLFDALKVTAATGEAYWQLAARILQASIDPATAMEPEDVTEMGEKLEEIVHDLRRHFVGQGIKLDWLQSTPPDPKATMEMLQGLFSVGSGIPKRVLFGSERGELASSQDERNYFGMINERQEQHAEPHLLRAFIDRMLRFGGLPRPSAKDYTVVWPALFELTEKEVAEANKLRAEAAKALTPMGGNPMDIVEIDTERNVWLRSTGQLPPLPMLEDKKVEPPPVPSGRQPAGSADGEDDEELPA